MKSKTNLLVEFLKAYDFNEVCEIKLDNEMPTFDYYEDPKSAKLRQATEKGVYLWVLKENKKPFEVIYVGLINNSTLEGRNKLHERGFKGKDNGGSNSGGNLKQGILKRIKEGGEIVIYFRKSNLINVMGEENISLCHIEEAALIKKFNNDSHNLMNAEAVRRRKKQSKKK